MKRFFVFLTLGAVLLSCSSKADMPDNSEGENNNPASTKIPALTAPVVGGTLDYVKSGAYIGENPYGYGETTYTYDAKGRISTIFTKDWYNEKMYGWPPYREGLRRAADIEIIFTYDESSYTCRQQQYQTWWDLDTGEIKADSRAMTDDHLLTFDGSWTKCIKAQITGNWADYNAWSDYEYYADGKIKSVTSYYGGAETEKYTYEWKDGDVESITMYYSGEDPVKVTFEYYPVEIPDQKLFQETASYYDIRMMHGLAGPMSKHYVSKSTITDMDDHGTRVTEIMYFIYEKDSQNRISKMTLREWDSEKGELASLTKNYWVTEFVYK